VSTSENNTAYQTAHLLIKETTMRHLTALSLSLSLVACMADVGGDKAGRDRMPSDDDCEKLEAEVTIRETADFDELPAGCWDLYGSLTISGSAITSLAPLNKLVGVNELRLVNTKLTTLDAEMPLKVYGPITISGNTQLASLDNLEVEAADDLAISVLVDDNALLADVDGLGELTRVDGDVTITNNPKLGAVTLNRLAQVTGVTRISNNALLASIQLDKLSLVHRVELNNNVALKTIGGFAAVTIKGDVVIRGNRALTTLGTSASLDRIEGGLTIDDNDALASVGMFSTAMQYLTGVLTISNNANLTDLGQLSHMAGIGSANVSSNPKLTTCKIIELDRCVPQHGTVTNVGNLTGTQCPATWCGR
jgi:hypothetical protein